MKVNSTVVLTLVLLFLMVGAGVISAAWGFNLGREALKGITQPDIRPTSNSSERKGLLPRREKVMILPEEEILSAVKARMEGNANDTNSNNQKSGAGNKSLDDQVNSGQSGFPVVSQDRGVTLEVTSARQQNGFYLLDVSLRNDGARTLRFLYTFLNITDEQGRILNTTAEGLPGELPPYSETFTGTVRIPSALIEKTQTLSLKLTDYPDQRLRLQMSDIPVVR
jgi:hypothetical protein